MAEASRVVLNGFELRTDAKIIWHPERYRDPRGEGFWGRVVGLLTELEEALTEDMAEQAKRNGVALN